MATEFQDLIDQCNGLVKDQKARVEAQNDFRDAFLLQDKEWKDGHPDWVKELRDPAPFQSIIVPTNILSSGDPQFTFEVPEGEAGTEIDDLAGIPDHLKNHIAPKLEPIPGQEPSTPEKDKGDQLEKLMKRSLHDSDVRQDMSLLREKVLSGFLYSQCIVKVADLRMNSLYKKDSHDLKGRLPFNYKACAPQTIYTERDSYGLSFVLHRYIRPLREVKRLYPGAKIPDTFKADEHKNVIWCEAWMPDKFCFWIQEVTDEVSVDATKDTDKLVLVQPIKKNALGFVPFCIRTARGSRLFDESNQQLFPMLYAGVTSQLFKRANLFLTVASTLAFGMANPQFALETQDPNEEAPTLDFNGPNIYKLKPGSKLTQINFALNKDVLGMLQLIQQKEEEATIPKALAGQISGQYGGSAASWLNMVIQGGKLEVVPVQMPVQECYVQAAEMTLEYIRRYQSMVGKGELDFYAKGKKVSVSEIPEYVDIKCAIQADLPQDQKLKMDIALAAWKDLFIDHETAWDIAGVEDKNRVRERLEKEKQQRAAEQQQPGMPQGQPPMGIPPGLRQGLPMPVEQNPMPPDMGQQMAGAMERIGEIPNG